jgi:hypothetical protein
MHVTWTAKVRCSGGPDQLGDATKDSFCVRRKNIIEGGALCLGEGAPKITQKLNLESHQRFGLRGVGRMRRPGGLLFCIIDLFWV